jgi:peptidoglycan/LPS O-acetylase OafA/YrhL
MRVADVDELKREGVQLTQAVDRPDRLEYLDSLRGIAAFLVVLHHVYQTAPFWPNFVRFSPFRLLLNGRSSVIFFFVLSGFVLAYGIWRGDQPVGFVRFVLRRLARIYLPYLVAGGVAIAAMILLRPGVLPDTAVTFNAMWPAPITWPAATGHLLLFGSAEANSVNTPSWSLVYEIRISILIPFLCFVAVRFGQLFFWLSVLAYALVELMMANLGISRVPFEAEAITDNILVSAHFAACFVLGLFIARAAIQRADWLYGMSTSRKALLTTIAVPLLFIFRDDTGAIGSAVLLTLALNTQKFQKFLRIPVLLFLGRISFSLYLTHTIVLQIVVRLLHDHVPLWNSLAVTMLLVIPVATLFYRAVERPALLLSKKIGRWGRTVPVQAIG